ncbi:polysaccharide biosynthesis tyrosine autokinase [Tessaracoccus antarcticus]|uniref:Polysaccharide biosynthesis tyrosine autokinase n=1 Tax=Tessaracoccus antarcticus TaxID=2479848 RepID=A0A3M0G069_9ACTN|nr:polysaccharide biosynthesis tyrosine autokinase [Tessaracoccus antarcticus]RMB58145.1 polysaccharide biosynthesis tyrosine autokinase [Tessaracoccus antarcticus]
MSLQDYLKTILRNWVLIFVVGVIGAAVGFGVALTTPEQYRSTSSLLVTSDRGDSPSELVQGSTYAENLVTTYVVLAKTEIVLQPVIDELGLASTVQSLASVVSADSPLNTVIIDIHADSQDPALSQRISSAVAASLVRVVTSEVSPTAEDGTATIKLTTIQSANLPKYPFAPNKRLHVLVGELLGLAVGVIFAITRSVFRQTVRSRDDVAQVTAVPVVGEVIGSPKGVTLPVNVLGDPQGIQAESVRSLAANLSFLSMGEQLRSFVITSASPAESKSSIVSSLGLAVAETQRVLLIDGDLRRPSLANLTQLEGATGLTNVLRGEISLQDAVQPWAKDGLHVLTSGALPPNPAQLLASSAMRSLISQARDEYDLVIIDSAPALSVTDAKWLGHMTDGALIASRYGKTSTRAIRKVIEAMEAASVPVLGVIITSVPRTSQSRYGEAGRESTETVVRSLEESTVAEPRHPSEQAERPPGSKAEAASRLQ